MRMFASLLVFLAVFFLSACTQQQNAPGNTGPTSAEDCPLSLPATYTAHIPCKNCLPTTVSLTLRPDSLYFVRIVAHNPETGNEDIKAEIGAWHYVPDGNTLLLATYDNVARTLSITLEDHLRVVKIAGKGIIPPDVNYDLIRDDATPGYYDVVRIKGMYSYAAGVGQFRECLSGAEFLLAREEENAALERAYLNTPHGRAEPMLVTLDARVSFRMENETAGYGDVLVPVHFIKIQPGVGCDGEKNRRLRLVDNSWRLIEMHGKPLSLGEGQQNPFLTLETRENRMHGFAGCNRFSGTYLVKGEILLLNKMISTRMACLGGMVIEDEFFRILSATEGYRIEGNILELCDRHGIVLARLQYSGGG